MKEMKKFLLMLLVAAVPMGMIACSDDDDPVDDKVLNEAAAGTYEGEFSAGSFGKGDMDVTITKTSGKEDEVSIKIGDLDVTALIQGTRADEPGEGDGDGDGDGDENGGGDEKAIVTFANISGVKLTGSSNNITIAEQEVETTISLASMGYNNVKATLKLKGTIVTQSSLKLNAGSFKADDAELQGLLSMLTSGVDIEAKKKTN